MTEYERLKESSRKNRRNKYTRRYTFCMTDAPVPHTPEPNAPDPESPHPADKSVEQMRIEERQYLQTEFQSALNAFQAVLSAVECPAESEWFLGLAFKLIESVRRTGADLLAATDSSFALPAVAWNSRNMLELFVWIRYCGQSEANARRFSDDALRDMKGLILALGDLKKLIGQAYPEEQSSHKQLDDMAKATIGVDPLGTDYLSVAAAAKAANVYDYYAPTNKFLSKLAHPTAVLVVGIMHQTKSLRDFQSTCLAYGTQAARECIFNLQGIVRALSSGSC